MFDLSLVQPIAARIAAAPAKPTKYFIRELLSIAPPKQGANTFPVQHDARESHLRIAIDTRVDNQEALRVETERRRTQGAKRATTFAAHERGATANRAPRSSQKVPSRI